MAPSERRDMTWTAEMRIGLHTLVLLSGRRWAIVKDLWFDEFSTQAAGKPNNNRLKNCLVSQHNMRSRPDGHRQWGHIGQTIDELTAQAPELVARLTAAYNARIGGAVELASHAHRCPHFWPLGDARASASAQPHPPNGTGPRMPFLTSTDNVGTTEPRTTEQELLLRRSINHGTPREIPWGVAHPEVPIFFYRYYDPHALHVINSPKLRGFISAYFSGPTIHYGFSKPPHTTSDEIFINIEIHVNRRPSPPSRLVSVTSNLHWVMTAAASKHRKGESVRISIIDARVAAGEDRGRAFHYQPYYDQIRERALFDDRGKMLYRGKYEYFIWEHIPASAVVADFAYAELRELCDKGAGLQTILRPSELEKWGNGGSDRIRQGWQRNPIDLLDPSIFDWLVKLIIWLICSHSSTSVTLSDALTKLVSDLTCGWVIRPSRRLTRSEWSEMALNFSRSLHAQLHTGITHDMLHETAKAFLYGIICGLGEPNWYMLPAPNAEVRQKMAQYGLEQPDEILRNSDNIMVTGVRSLIAAPQIPARPSQTRSPRTTPRKPGRASHNTSAAIQTPASASSKVRPGPDESPVTPRNGLNTGLATPSTTPIPRSGATNAFRYPRYLQDPDT